ncbi:tyrosine-type recombinase/integrase [Rhizobium sp. P32RR-XVIII]|uniref:tyrosine-type recombinase/integrase n=1 Tax=Rhizobium sp. P32RR-XVIII TaxID=2726738 RepID=UPI001FEFF743|nr:tyrosine-type recombinase/integrase [Rhizobium sp. P32RR-XVIII]
MEDMPRKPFLSHETTRHGKLVWYFKRKGKRVRLKGEYGSDEFNSAYEKALTGSIPTVEAPKSRTGSLKWLVDQYKRSAAFAELAQGTRRARDNILKQVLEKNGDLPFGRMTKADIKAGIDKRAATPNAANNFLKTMSHLFKWAIEAEHVEINPVTGVSKVNVKSDGFHTWTVEQVEKYRAHHKLGTKSRLAIDILLFLGLRRGDAVVVGRQHLKDGVISLKTEKTGQWVYLPVFKQLMDSMEATPTGDLAFLTTERGKPFSSGASFGNWFAKQCKAAGLPDECRAHGLRKAGATIAADEGATAHELMAMFGWSRLAMAEIYTKEADKKKLAKSASERLANRM